MRESFPLKGSLLRSPKQPVLARDRDWYPYYAAFTEGFVSSVIESYLSDATLVLDPWNGSGTTTSVCAQKGISSIGIDINPALTVIAKARLKVGECYESLGELCNRIISEITKRNKNEQPDDLLLHWMRPSSVSHIRAIQSAIHQCNTNGMDNCYSLDAITRANSFDNTCCFSYCALFMSVRKLLQRFTTTNPTWFKEPATIAQRIAPSEELCLKVFVESFDRLRNLISKSRVSSSNARFLTQDSQRLPFGDGEIDGVITSPPYATRIDYVKGVLPELAVLGADRGFLTKLRQDSLGTPVVRGYNQKLPSNLSSKYGIETLKHIRDHSSK
ncbi:MAG: site-specific DNA-methyltransferase, partial [Gammaproteobacteria bacterium]|nr:site-specific DNA-methyltransferase [Gammaproteobacteria bacterium]